MQIKGENLIYLPCLYGNWLLLMNQSHAQTLSKLDYL